MNRRTFLQSSATLAAVAPFGAIAAEAEKKKRPSNRPEAAGGPAEFKPTRTTPRPNKKGLMFSTFPRRGTESMSLTEKFQMLKTAGFHGVEVSSGQNNRDVLAARDTAGLEIPSVLMSSHWTHPLSSPNPAETRKPTAQSRCCWCRRW
jgi:hypothetical protein